LSTTYHDSLIKKENIDENKQDLSFEL